jgi:hypothetical protein
MPGQPKVVFSLNTRAKRVKGGPHANFEGKSLRPRGVTVSVTVRAGGRIREPATPDVGARAFGAQP